MSTALPIADGRVWTLADLEGLPGDLDWRRFEIDDGSLVVSPHAGRPHEYVVPSLIAMLKVGARTDDIVLAATMIDLHPSYRVTDVTVLTRVAYDGPESAVRPNGVVLAVEIESPSSRTTDRVTKPAQYAAGGIEHYWRLELDPIVLHTYRLDGAGYAATGEWSGREVAHVAEPFDCHVDLGALLPD